MIVRNLPLPHAGEGPQVCFRNQVCLRAAYINHKMNGRLSADVLMYSNLSKL
jgi:hypothetical protein